MKDFFSVIIIEEFTEPDMRQSVGAESTERDTT